MKSAAVLPFPPRNALPFSRPTSQRDHIYPVRDKQTQLAPDRSPVKDCPLNTAESVLLRFCFSWRYPRFLPLSGFLLPPPTLHQDRRLGCSKFLRKYAKRLTKWTQVFFSFKTSCCNKTSNKWLCGFCVGAKWGGPAPVASFPHGSCFFWRSSFRNKLPHHAVRFYRKGHGKMLPPQLSSNMSGLGVTLLFFKVANLH